MSNRYLAKRLLKRLVACSEAIGWVGTRDYATAWRECERGDWMLWIAAKMIGRTGWPSHQEVVLAACACAARSLKYIPKGEKRPARAIRVARAWARGDAQIDDVRGAADAANDAASAYANDAYLAYDGSDAANAANAAYAAAAYAASAANASYAAAAYAAAAYAADAAYAAAHASYAANASYADDAAAAARFSSLRESARICRRMLKPLWEEMT